ncbi:hypothetical protein IW137_002517, partial [Coemansia sp. RSA 1287]
GLKFNDMTLEFAAVDEETAAAFFERAKAAGISARGNSRGGSRGGARGNRRGGFRGK